MVILFDQFNLPESIYEVVFATEQQKVVGELLIHYIKEKGGSVNKAEMSSFATDLHEGKIKHEGKSISYNKRQFYDRILTPMKGMGLVSYHMYKRTYSLSKNFVDALQRIGEMWVKEHDTKL
ncbi:hypothetical protein KY320_03150 [Candidatus Woesearchaeota archaeon]|nr:hypothetical protein [Candidatus Woesearchaeota archaeon]